MVAWWWILVALFGGAFLGVLMISLCVAAAGRIAIVLPVSTTQHCRGKYDRR